MVGDVRNAENGGANRFRVVSRVSHVDGEGYGVAERNNLSKEDAGQRLDSLLAGLQLLDRIEITQSCEAGKLSLTLRVQMAQSLK